MTKEKQFTIKVALIVAMGGFLMGFDASVISGVIKFIEPEFQLTKLELGWAVSSLSLTATLAMMTAGPLSDKFGRKKLLKYTAIIFGISAIGSALAPNFITFVIARMLGGIGVGASLILAPIYIAEISPAKMRGQMVSFNQLNIVLGISVAFFTNYLILQLGQSDASWAQSLKLDQWNWRWMLGLEILPAIFYYVALFIVPESPRWLAMNGREDEALEIMKKVTNEEDAKEQLKAVHTSVAADVEKEKVSIKELFKPAMKLVLTIGIGLAILQQITGMNAVLFYAPMIFEQSGIGTDASFIQAILVGLTNLVFTIIAILLIDKLGRKPLLIFGMAFMAISLFVLAFGFNSATYTLSKDSAKGLPTEIKQSQLESLIGQTFDDELTYKVALTKELGEKTFKEHESSLVTAAVSINSMLILLGILGFVAAFAVSIGPIMWVMFSELFPNRIRGIAISFVGLISSAISFGIQFIFPWELANLGNTITFLIFGVFAALGFVFIIFIVPETKGKSLEELEAMLVK
jgi:sugar porter (SP) family MFS transporter